MRFVVYSQWLVVVHILLKCGLYSLAFFIPFVCFEWLQCVKQYIEVQIDDNQASVITCPDPDCSRHGIIDIAEVK